MRPRERRESGKQDLFRSRLDQIIDMNHALVKLALSSAFGVLGCSSFALAIPLPYLSHLSYAIHARPLLGINQ
jgi:hypothetical protein